MPDDPIPPTPADQRLAAAALKKQRAGQKPTREEGAALRRVQRLRDEQLRSEHYRAIRKREWQGWSGRQQKVLNEQAARYGIPIGAATIDLPAVVRWLHEFLAENARRLAAGDDDDPALAGVSSPGLERYRLARAKREELFLRRDLGAWLPRDQVRAGFAPFAAIIRRCGERLGRKYGREAQQILDEHLDRAAEALNRLFLAGPVDTGDDDEPKQGGA
jgi:hypothetical protein